MKFLTPKNFKILLKKFNELNKWKNIPCSWTGKYNIAKMAIFHKLIYRFNSIPTRIPADIFIEINKMLLKFTWNSNGLRIAKQI